MIEDEIIARLLATGVFAAVEGVAEISLIKGMPAACPAAYVVPAVETAGPNAFVGTGVVRQLIDADLSLFLVAFDVTGSASAGGGQAIGALKAAARDALIGWTPPSAHMEITELGGRIVLAVDGHVWWEMGLATSYFNQP